MADFTEEFTKAINTVVEKAKEYGGIAKIQALIKAEEAKKQEQYYRLGKKYYELYKDAPASDLAEIMNKLLACDEKIEEYRKVLKDAQDAKYTDVSDAAAEDAEDAIFEEVTEAEETNAPEEVEMPEETVAEEETTEE